MDWLRIRYFFVLAEELHFSNAAFRLHLTQSALSRHIQALESAVGVKLFERNKRRVALTAAGEYLRTEWGQLMRQVANVQAHAQQIAAGTIGHLTLAHPGSVTHSLLPDVVTALTTALPQVRLELRELADEGLQQALLAHKVALGFRREPLTHPQLSCQLVYSEPLALVVPLAYELPTPAFTGLSQFRDQAFILPDLTTETPYVALLNRLFTESNFTPQVVIESEFGATTLALVKAGLGVSVMPSSYELAKPGGVRFIALSTTSQVYLLWHKDNGAPMFQRALSIVLTCLAAYSTANRGTFL